MSEIIGRKASVAGTIIEVQRSTNAMISLIAGILGLTAIPFVGSVIAILTAKIAKEEIEESSGTLVGAGMARVGQVLGWIGIGLMAFMVCLAGLVFFTSLSLIVFFFQQAMGDAISLVFLFI